MLCIPDHCDVSLSKVIHEPQGGHQATERGRDAHSVAISTTNGGAPTYASPLALCHIYSPGYLVDFP
jgi:hypothetical protein